MTLIFVIALRKYDSSQDFETGNRDFKYNPLDKEVIFTNKEFLFLYKSPVFLIKFSLRNQITLAIEC